MKRIYKYYVYTENDKFSKEYIIELVNSYDIKAFVKFANDNNIIIQRAPVYKDKLGNIELLTNPRTKDNIKPTKLIVKFTI